MIVGVHERLIKDSRVLCKALAVGFSKARLLWKVGNGFEFLCLVRGFGKVSVVIIFQV